MDNEYVHKDVFDWLESNIGPVAEGNRSSKYAKSEKWAYGIDGRPDDRRSNQFGVVPTAYNHVFFFKDAADAVRFKLTWA